MHASAARLVTTLVALQLCPDVLGGPQHQPFVLNADWRLRLTQVQNFRWEKCGPSSLPAVIKSMSIEPDPIPIPGDVTCSVSAATTMALTPPLQAVVTLEKKLGDIWIKLPCVDDIGSCTYKDICTDLDRLIPPGQACPEPLQSFDIPCHCPFKAGTYNLPTSQFYIPNMDLPSFLTNGNYQLKVELSIGDQDLACYVFYFSLHAESAWFW
ncbi:ganglioside GM2 activator [Hemicordylus capensis]|uniref:ganglioside GM2 activator n=1 Tax=Hemicordylus capensis TaxID=884348 RepID=UPI0023043E6C|nr:ganglioside GM2 activator [Hemicordylus capensis]